MNVIETKNLSYTYNIGTESEVTAVDRVTASIKSGEIIGIIGQTGSGKSTFVQMLNGLISQTDGEVYIKGKNIRDKTFDMTKLCFDVGLVFQYPEYQLFADKVYDDISFGPKNKGITGDELRRVVEDAARFVGVDENLFEKSPFELSGGEKRRVAIAGVVAMNPEIVIFDEPTAGLDPLSHQELIRSILTYHEEKKNTIIFISHVMEDIAVISDRVMVFDKGRLVKFDTPKKVFSDKSELYKIGLGVPKITEIMDRLRLKGYSVASDVVTLEQAEREVLSLLRERKVK